MVEVGKISVKAEMDTSSVSKTFSEMKRQSRSTRSEMQLFGESLGKIGSIAGTAFGILGTGAGALGALANAASVGGQTASALAKAKVIGTNVGLSLDQKLGPTFNKIVDAVGGAGSSNLANAGIGAVIGGAVGAIAGSVIPGIGTAAGAAVGTGLGAGAGLLYESYVEKTQDMPDLLEYASQQASSPSKDSSALGKFFNMVVNSLTINSDKVTYSG
jgi:hypothetical protein